MAFSSTRNPGERPKSLIFRNPVAQTDETPYNPYPTPLSPIRNPNTTRNVPPSPAAANDIRNSLQRRFTTNALPSLAPIGEQRKQTNERGENTAKTYNRMSAAEQRARQYEALLEQQRNIQAQMAMIDPETRREVDEARKLEFDINQYTSTVLSEPGTPPDHRLHHIQPPYANRFSTSTLASPGIVSNRQSRPGSQMTSPPADFANPYFPNQDLPSQSVPGSQRNSDHEESDDDYNFAYATVRPKAGANPNRISLPVTAFDLRNQNQSLSSFSPILRPVNGTGLHFADDDGRKSKRSSAVLTTSPDSKTFLQLHQTDDKFPILVRRGNENITAFSGPVTPLDTSEDSGPEGYMRTDRNIAARHRQSLPPNVVRNSAHFAEGIPGLDSLLSDATAVKNTAANRRSLEVKFGGMADQKRPGLLVSPQKNGMNGISKVSASYSTNDIPTLKSITAISHDSKNGSASQTPAEEKPSPIQNLPIGLSKPLAPGSGSASSQAHAQSQSQPALSPESDGLYRQTQPGFYGTSSFGQGYVPAQQDATAGASAHNNAAHHYSRGSNNHNSMNGFGADMLNNALGNMSLGGNRSSWQPPTSSYQQNYQGYPSYGAAQGPTGNRYGDASGRSATQRRNTQTNDDTMRFANAPLEALKGEIAGLCKDQHGCRFLQKKLEERNPEHTRIIFEETLPHVVELMTDPFGNYLCQKLLEYANDDQRTALIQEAADYMVRIALNQHGTRALQKMIEFISTQQQVDMITKALKDQVVQLIQDLNGNHVIQKCLNHLKQDNVQFIVDAVCAHVVTVGTHRHGCCVLQRCVDHASSLQKGQLVGSITQNVFALVQDPFGNYVVQYILDLGEPAFSEPLCQSMVGSVYALARQKFSSNVIEKGIRTAGEDTRRRLIAEMLNPIELQKMLRDSFANYVVQTAIDYADEETKSSLFNLIRPILPNIRHTPYGRRIQTKIQDYDARRAEAIGAPLPNDMNAAQFSGFGGTNGDNVPRANYGPPGFGMGGPGAGPPPYHYQPHPAGPPGPGYGFANGQGRMQNYPTVGRGGPHGMNFF
ncbi:ARM repeat-containing protein [Myriangium duriaei CBS 260.36]|uniref:ARM repeat-containing protein n=1 Tax=Myriangium duriaei CBS 260.36 TaxID=1168546 RepID=A0A9P4MKD0_9PEZI|nr:ARM repeat-containing protein [Myriangium duriaei CBS 260.36]